MQGLEDEDKQSIGFTAAILVNQERLPLTKEDLDTW